MKEDAAIILGFIAGDMIGSPYERRSDTIKTTDFPLFCERSRYTDDTVLTIAVMDWLMSDSEHTWDYLAKKFVYYGTRYRINGTDRCFGDAFTAWLFDEKRPLGRESISNGGAMRVSPVGFFFNTVEEVEEVAKIQASLTHNHPISIQSSQVAAVSVLLARQGKTKTEIQAFIEQRYGWNLHKDFNLFRADYEWTMNCQNTVEGALMSFLNAPDFEGTIRNIVSLGGDSDTMGAIACPIAEVFFGGVPDYIKKEVYKREIPDEFLHIMKHFSQIVAYS